MIMLNNPKKDLRSMNDFWGEWKITIWNEMELFGMKLKYVELIKMNEKEFSRSAPTRNIPLHRQD